MARRLTTSGVHGKTRSKVAAAKTLKVEHWAVGFLDLLGQRAALRRMDFLPDTRDEAKVAELVEAVRDSVGVIKGFFGLYEAFIKGSDRSTTVDRFRDLPPAAQRMAREWRSSELRHTRFSDGLAVYSSLVQSPTHSPVNTLYQMICASGSLMFISLAWGHPIRGGLDVGTGIEVEAGQLHGPGVVKAYELESRIAEYPRIVVGKTLTDYLRWQAEKEGDVRVQLDAHLATVLRQMLWQDADGQTIVDYMGQAFKDKVAFQIDREMVHKAQLFASTSFEHFKKTGDKRLADRYERLVAYFDRRVSVWV